MVALYAAAAVVALVIVNADQSDAPAAAGIMAAAALALGWGTASGWGVVVAWFLVPLALPFGDTNQFVGGDGTDSVALLAVVAAVISTALILGAAGARILYNQHRPDSRPREDSPPGRPREDYPHGRVREEHPDDRAGNPGENGALQEPDQPSALEPDLEDAVSTSTPPATHRR